MKNCNKTKLSLLQMKAYELELELLKIEDRIEDIRSINDYRNMSMDYLLDKKISLQMQLNATNAAIHNVLFIE